MNRRLMGLLMCLWGTSLAAAETPTCTGKFLNPLTDICWSCLFPISLGGAPLGTLGQQEDIDNPPSPLCSCGSNPSIGLSIGFWEPARQVEVVRKPYCLVSLGGLDLSLGLRAPEAARFTRAEGDGDGGGFYQAHEIGRAHV